MVTVVNGVVITMLKSATSVFGDVKNYLVPQRKLHLYYTMQRYVCVGKTQIIWDMCYFTVSENITNMVICGIRFSHIFGHIGTRNKKMDEGA